MLLFVYTTTHKRSVIFTCRYFKLSWNTTALNQSDCRNFSCSSKNMNTCTKSEKLIIISVSIPNITLKKLLLVVITISDSLRYFTRVFGASTWCQSGFKIRQINVNRISRIGRFCLPLKTVSVEFNQKTVRSKHEISCIPETIFAILNTEVVVNHVCWPPSGLSKRSHWALCWHIVPGFLPV